MTVLISKVCFFNLETSYVTAAAITVILLILMMIGKCHAFTHILLINIPK